MSRADNATDNSLSFNLSCASAVSCGLSICGAIGIFLTFALFPGIRNTARKLMTFLTIADFLQTSGYLAAIVRQGFGDHVSDKEFCKIQSVITTFASLVSFFLTVAIAFYLFVAVNRREVSSTCVLVVSNVVSWTVPGIIVAIALKEDMLGRNESNRSIEIGPLCWVTFEKQHLQKSIKYMFLTGKGWELACYLLTATFYVLLKFTLYLRHRFKHLYEINPDLRADDRNFLYVWLVFLVIRAWGTIRFFMLIADSGETMKTAEEVLSYLQAIFDPSQALLNFILFCLLDREVRQRMCQRCNTRDYVRMRNNDINNDVTQQQRIVNASFYEELFADNGHEDQSLIFRSNERSGVLSKIETSYYGTDLKRKYDSAKTRESSFSNKSFTV